MRRSIFASGMKILLLGGTRFLGRHFVEAAREHELTLFHRGKTELFPELEHVHGDRDGGLGALDGRAWDAVVDFCGYVPRLVRDARRIRAGLRVFVSTLSAYQDFTNPESPLHDADPGTETVTPDTYGPLKALCEKEVDGLIVRPGLIVGPHDPTDRFTYWPARVARGGAVLAFRRRVQFIDARDLAAWMVRSVEAGRRGAFNAVCAPVEMSDVLETCRRVAGSDARFVYLDDATLERHGVVPFTELPLWIPRAHDRWPSEIPTRPLEETVRDTLEWNRTPTRAGLTAEREQMILRIRRP